MAVNHSVYLVLLCYAAGAHESFQKERDPEIMDSFFTTTMFLGRLRQRKKKAPPSRYSLKLQTHISLSINELKVAGVSVAICARTTPGRSSAAQFGSIENRNLQTSLLIVANRPDLGSVNKIFSSRSNTLLWLRSLGEQRVIDSATRVSEKKTS